MILSSIYHILPCVCIHSDKKIDRERETNQNTHALATHNIVMYVIYTLLCMEYKYLCTHNMHMSSYISIYKFKTI